MNNPLLANIGISTKTKPVIDRVTTVIESNDLESNDLESYDLESYDAWQTVEISDMEAEYDRLTRAAVSTDAFADFIMLTKETGGLNRASANMAQVAFEALTASLPDNVKEELTSIDLESFDDAGTRTTATDVTNEAFKFSARRAAAAAADMVEKLIDAIVKAYQKYAGKMARNNRAIKAFLLTSKVISGSTTVKDVPLKDGKYMTMEKKEIKLSDVDVFTKYVRAITKTSPIKLAIVAYTKALKAAKVSTKDEITTSVDGIKLAVVDFRGAMKEGLGATIIKPSGKENGYKDVKENRHSKTLPGDAMVVIGIPADDSDKLMMAKVTHAQTKPPAKTAVLLSKSDVNAYSAAALALNTEVIALNTFGSEIAEEVRAASKAARMLGDALEKSDVSNESKKELLTHITNVKSMLAVVKEPISGVVSLGASVAGALHSRAVSSYKEYK